MAIPPTTDIEPAGGEEPRALQRPATRLPLRAAGPSPAAQTQQFGNLLEVVWLRKWTVLLCLVAGLIASLVYLARATPVYRSAAMIYLDQTNPQVMGNMFSGFSRQTLAAQAQVITSTTILARALELPAMKQATSLWAADSPIGTLRAFLDVAAAQDSGDILIISYESPHAQDNAIMVNSVVQAYSEYHNDRRRNTAAEVLKILQKEKHALNNELKRLTSDMLDFQRRHGTLAFGTGEGNLLGPRLSQLSATLTEAELRSMNAKLAYEAAQAAGGDLQTLQLLAATDPSFEGFSLSDSGAVSPQAQQLAHLEHERDRLESLFGEQHQQLRYLKSEIRSLRKQLRIGGQEVNPNSPAKFFLDLLRQRWENAAEAEKQLRAMFEEQEKEAIEMNSLATEYGQMGAAGQRVERQLELIDHRIRELNVNEDYDIINVTILEPAEAGRTPVRPNRPQIAAIAMVLSLMIGLGAAFLQELLDDRLRSSEEIATLLDLPVLGVIPMNSEKTASMCGRLVESQPHSAEAEAFRTVRTALHFSAARSRGQVLLVTSPAPGDGKSTVTSNLGIAMAQAGKRTLILDSDCRKPRQHRIFELEGHEQGLTTLLVGASVPGAGELESAVSAVIRPTGVDGLDILPCGAIPTNPAEMLNGELFQRLLEHLRGRYDQIVVDSPPVVPVSDGRIVAAAADAFILVLRAGKSGRRMAAHALELLESVGGRPAGLIINGVTKSWGSYAYYSRYGYYQHYREGYGESAGRGNGNGAGNGAGAPAAGVAEPARLPEPREAERLLSQDTNEVQP